MGKEDLTARKDLWITHQFPQHAMVDPPDHPRLPKHAHSSRHSPAGRRPFSFGMFRQISPVLMPLALGGTSFAIVTLLTIGTPDLVPVSITPDLLGPLFFVFAALAVIYAAVLAYAPNDTIWALALVGGLIAFGSLASWAIFGLATAAALIVGLGLLLIVVVRSQLQTVLENTVHVMVLFGKYSRTLRPGFNLRIPGEQLLAIVHTAEIVVEATVRDIPLHKGPKIDASAVAACRVVQERAHLTAAHATDWPDHTRRCLELALGEALGEMEADDVLRESLDGEGALYDGSLATRVRGHLLQLVGRWGISIEWVRLEAIHVSKTAEKLPVRETTGVSAPAPAVTPAPNVEPVASASSAASVVTPDVALSAKPAPTPVATARGLSPGAILPLPPAMRTGVPVPEALIEAYEAVRGGRISDPRTIARIARAFET
ncbi:MAG TPA: SPFH domain-containing protein, partial [Ktedonobacterales bacterium]|nr:SPFH domain-containing protein [Ktedonobacterales bacterium]